MKFFIVDCFAQERYEGNQLAVFIADKHLPATDMQKIAREMNFSEVSFIISKKQENEGFDVRIYTPAIEVEFAGHPVLGTAYVIKNYYKLDSRPIKLNLGCGQIPVSHDGSMYFMIQNQPVFGKIIDKSDAANALSIDPGAIREDLPVQCVSTGLEAAIIPLKSLDDIARCKVDHTLMPGFHKKWRKCNLLVFAQNSDELRVRVFMDDPGYLEDPATGSANGDLAAYLLHYSGLFYTNINYVAMQGIEMGRPSALYVTGVRENEKYMIQVGGKVIQIAEGEWL